MFSSATSQTLLAQAHPNAAAHTLLTLPLAPNTSSVESDSGSEGSASDDLVFHFGAMNIDRSWQKAVRRAGYSDMDELAAKFAEDRSLQTFARELNMPEVVRVKLVAGFTSWESGTFTIDFAMPQHDLLSNVPMQSDRRSVDDWMVIVFVGGVIAAFGVALFARSVWAGMAASTAATIPAALPIAAAALADCLDGDAEITLSSREKKKIKDVKRGDAILSVHKGNKKIRIVREVKSGQSSNVCKLSLQDASGRSFTIKATSGHPFYTTTKGWAVPNPEKVQFSGSAPVPKLQVRDKLVLQSGRTVHVTRIDTVVQNIKAYNLVLDAPGTFFVNDVLSHSGLHSAHK